MTLFKGKKALAFIASVIASFTFAMGMEADHSASAAGQTGYVSTNEGWRWLENGQKYMDSVSTWVRITGSSMGCVRILVGVKLGA